jgi:hypothetical protein
VRVVFPELPRIVRNRNKLLKKREMPPAGLVVSKDLLPGVFSRVSVRSANAISEFAILRRLN